MSKMMPINIHEDIENWKYASEKNYVDCIQGLIKKKPFGDHKFYIYSFPKRKDDNAGIKVLYHQPRLTKPEPLPGTTLIKVDPRDPEEAKIIWTLPEQESFTLYKKDKIFGDNFVYDCIQDYLHRPQKLMAKEPDDLSDEEIRDIYRDKVKKGQQKLTLE